MSNAITRSILQTAVTEAAAAVIRGAATAVATPSQAAAAAEQVASDVVADPRLAPALEPVSPLQSQTIRGIVIAAGAPLLVALGRAFGVEIVDGDAATLVSTAISLAGAAYAWRGRKTTTRPLK